MVAREISRDPAWHGMAWMMLLGGCAPVASTPDEMVPAEPSRQTEIVHDLGVVLARGQSIEHEFQLVNPTGQPIHVVVAHAITPCCSQVVAAPTIIPPRRSATLKVIFKPGISDGRKSVAFVAQTDNEVLPVYTCQLRADLLPEVSVTQVDATSVSLMLGESGKQAFLVISRRHGDEGLDAPQAVKVSGDLSARFVGESRRRQLENGVVETIRELVVEIPARHEHGSQSGSLTFTWPGGRTREHVVHWNVMPHVTASPDGLVIGPAEGREQSVMVRSRTAPFRVLGVQGLDTLPGLRTTFPDGAATLHVLKFVFDAAIPSRRGPFDLIIETDHPQQSRVAVSVLFIGGEKP